MRKWKWNWGTGLAIALGLFVLSMGYTMYLVFQQRFDLVTTNYYEEELAYQETIDRKEQALKLNESCKLELKDGQLDSEFIYFAYVLNAPQAAGVRGGAIGQGAVLEFRKFKTGLGLYKKNTYFSNESVNNIGKLHTLMGAI